jgi:hypothetical protein
MTSIITKAVFYLIILGHLKFYLIYVPMRTTGITNTPVFRLREDSAMHKTGWSGEILASYTLPIM